MKVKRFNHAYETEVAYRLCFGHGPAHVAYETSIMLEILDRLTPDSQGPMTVLELGSGPQSLYRDLWLKFAPKLLKAPMHRYLGSDVLVKPGTRDIIAWDVTKPVSAKYQDLADVVLMPYYLANSLLDWTTWEPLDEQRMLQVYQSIERILKPGGLLIMHTPYHSPDRLGRKEEWTPDNFANYDTATKVLELFGVDPQSVKRPIIYKSWGMTNVTKQFIVDKVRKLDVYIEYKAGGRETLRFEFSNNGIYYPRGKVQRQTNPVLKQVARFLADEEIGMEDMVEPVEADDFESGVQYWSVFRNTKGNKK